jgi:thymidylate synthase ThyX
MAILSIIPLSWMNCQLTIHNKIHGNLEIREYAKKIIHELEAENPTSYVLVSNVHTSCY